MATTPKTKVTFGGCNVDHFSPPFQDDGKRRGINTIISFEEILKLHLSLGQVLTKLNGYNRNTKEGKRSAVNICIYTHSNRITVNEGKLKKS